MRLASAVEDDRGTVTAEFATVMPAVLLVLVLVLGAFQAVSAQMSIVDAAAVAARSLGRGESEGVAVSRVNSLIGEHTFRSSTEGDFVCVSLTASVHLAAVVLDGVSVAAHSCALSGGL